MISGFFYFLNSVKPPRYLTKFSLKYPEIVTFFDDLKGIYEIETLYILTGFFL
jgi:hypothetical protein